jgi:hypothetical protein
VPPATECSPLSSAIFVNGICCRDHADRPALAVAEHDQCRANLPNGRGGVQQHFGWGVLAAARQERLEGVMTGKSLVSKSRPVFFQERTLR